MKDYHEFFVKKVSIYIYIFSNRAIHLCPSNRAVSTINETAILAMFHWLANMTNLFGLVYFSHCIGKILEGGAI